MIKSYQSRAARTAHRAAPSVLAVVIVLLAAFFFLMTVFGVAISLTLTGLPVHNAFLLAGACGGAVAAVFLFVFLALDL